MMYPKTLFALLAFFVMTGSAFAQRLTLEENKNVSENGFQYEFLVKNEQLKEAGNDTFSRYEIRFTITNLSGCSKFYKDSEGFFSSADKSLLATFYCLNANGKRFTSKSAKINCREWNINVKKRVNDKDVYELVKAGYAFRNQQTLIADVIVLVPRGERPRIECLVNRLPLWE